MVEYGLEEDIAITTAFVNACNLPREDTQCLSSYEQWTLVFDGFVELFGNVNNRTRKQVQQRQLQIDLMVRKYVEIQKKIHGYAPQHMTVAITVSKSIILFKFEM